MKARFRLCGVVARFAKASSLACGIRAHDARIATFGERVEDLFELTDARNQELEEVQIRALRRP